MGKTMLKKILKYLFSSALAIGILYWAFSKSDLRWQDLVLTLEKAHYFWVGISILLSYLAHAFRAWRWNLLLAPMEQHPGFLRSFFAVLIGYFANFLAPRMGEISRCASLNKTAHVPISSSFGTVITERLVDVACLGMVFLMAIGLEFETIQRYLFPQMPQLSWSLALGLLGFAALSLALIWWQRKQVLSFWRENISKKTWGHKIQEAWDGVASIAQLKQPMLFLGLSLGIWLGYFFTNYTLLLAFNQTQDLGWVHAFTLLLMGTIGMAAPTQGGIGVYHSMVAGTLALYGIQAKDGMALATFFHGTQMFSILFLGGIAFIFTLFLKPSHEQRTKNS